MVGNFLIHSHNVRVMGRLAAFTIVGAENQFTRYNKFYFTFSGPTAVTLLL